MWDGNKKLDSPSLTPYHTPMLRGARSLGAAGATEGPARQLWPATLASPPSMRRILMVATHYSLFPAPYVIFFCVLPPHDCFLARAENFCMPVKSLWMAFLKDTNS